MAGEQQPREAIPPRNVEVILLDSLNRRLLETYGSSEFTTPNLKRFAERSCASRTITRDRCRACPPAMTCFAARSKRHQSVFVPLPSIW